MTWSTVRRRAERNHGSLQGELRTISKAAVDEDEGAKDVGVLPREVLAGLEQMGCAAHPRRRR